MGVLKVRDPVNSVWIPISNSLDEVWIGDNVTPPLPVPTGTFELWYDTTSTPGTLNVAVGGVWVPMITTNEVIIGGPMPTDPTVELWLDTAPMSAVPPQPPVLYAQTGPVAGPPVWTPLAGAEREVYVGLDDPYVTDPTLVEGQVDLWQDTNDDGVLNVRVGGVWKRVTQREVWVDDEDPYARVTNPALPGEAELWYDNSTIPGTLNVWTEDSTGTLVWTPIGGEEVEVAVGVDDPYVLDPSASGIDLWWDTNDDPGTLKVRVGAAWVPATQREVWVDDEDPYARATNPAVNEEAELWYDTNDDGALKVRHNGAWINVTAREVWVDDEDPYLRATSPAVNEEAEIWYDTTDDPGSLKVRHNGAWIKAVPREVWVDDEDPYLRAVNPATDEEAELWYDTVNGVLMVRHEGVWTPVTDSPEPPLDEVWVGQGSPDPAGTFEIWYDTSTEPGVLKIKRENGVWEEVGGVNEVIVGDTDPYVADPSAVDELWWDTTDDPGTLKVRVGATWVNVTQREVWVDDEDPYLRATNPATGEEAELWYDTNDDGSLKVRHNGAWVNVTAREVWVDDEDPYLRAVNPAINEEAEIWYDTNDDPGTLKVRHNGNWINAVAREVWVDDEDPYTRTVNPAVNEEAELWFDTNDDGVLKVRHNGAWQNVTQREVWVDDEDPYTRLVNPADNEEAELWFDTSTDPGVLKVRHNGAWQEVLPPPLSMPNEVQVSPAQPADITTELWADTTDALEPVLKANVSGNWVEISPSEVHIGVDDPYMTPEGSHAELWHDTSLSQNGVLKARVGGSWRPINELSPDEVTVSVTDPIAFNPGCEMWIDTSTTPVTLWGRVNNAWVQLTSDAPLPAPQEVEIGPAAPREVTVELWYDTTDSPNGTLFANNFGVWEEIGADEIFVGLEDPYVTNPDTQKTIWHDTNDDPGTHKVRVNGVWVPVVPREVWVDDEDPYTRATNPAVNEEAELWYDTNNDGMLRVRHNGTWVNVNQREVWVDDEDPYLRVVDPAIGNEAELWYDTTDDPGTLKVRHNGAWVNVTQREVFVDDQDPLTRTPPSPEAELWYDLSAMPHVLKANVSGVWEAVVPDIVDPPNEVEVGGAPPRDVQTELWVDTNEDPPVLNAKINDVWTPVGASVSEVAIGDTPPDLSDPAVLDELFWDTTANQLFVRIETPIPHWEPTATLPANEVFVGTAEPTPDVELWFDTTSDPGTLKAKVNGAWVTITTDVPDPPNEVEVSPAQPRDITTELWVDTTTDPAVLKANVNGTWMPVGESASEVAIADVDPYVTDSAATDELWFDTTTQLINVRVNDDWTPWPIPIPPNEVFVGNDEPTTPDVELWFDPDAVSADENVPWGGVFPELTYGSAPDPGSTETFSRGDHTHGTPPEEVVIRASDPIDPAHPYFDLWVDTSAAAPVLKARIGDNPATWVPVGGGSNEVTVATTDPYVTDPASTDELWFDVTDDPGTMYARVAGGWQQVTQREVFVDDEDPLTRPNPSPEAELWYDTSTAPGMLKANVGGTWVDVTSPAGVEHEVYVQATDPLPTDALAELWYTPQSAPPPVPPALWDVAVTYSTGEWSQWPDATQHWQTSRTTTGEEPGTTLPAPPADGVVFPGSDPTQIGGFSSVPVPAGFDITNGFDIRVDSGVGFGVGDLFMINSGFQLSVNGGMITVVNRSGPDVASGSPPANRWLRCVVDGAGAEFFSSPDGVTWTSGGTPATYSLPTAQGQMYLGNAGASNTCYGGQINSVQTYDATGTTLMQSWVRATQPGALGAGVSPLTGEDYPDPTDCVDIGGGVAPVNPWIAVPPPPTASAPGVLRANVNGVWEDIATGSVGTDEVWIGPNAPVDPLAELWYDEDAPDPVYSGYLPLDGSGVMAGPLDMDGQVIQFDAVVGPKITLYPGVGGDFGIGIASGRTEYTVPDPANKHSFLVGGIEEAFIDQNGLGPRQTIQATLEAGWAGGDGTLSGDAASFRINPAMVTVCLNQVGGPVVGANVASKICGYPAGVPAPWERVAAVGLAFPAAYVQHNTVLVECRSDGVYCIGSGDGGDLPSGWRITASVTWSR